MDAHQTSLFAAVLIAVAVLAVVIAYFILIVFRHQRRNNELYKAKILAEVTTLEKERARIANDLHDELGPILSSVKLRINNLDVYEEEDTEQINKINKLIDDVIQRMRDISNDLLPTTLQRKGLIPALEESISKVNRPGTLVIHFTHENVPELPVDKSVNLYRILQEVIHNTIKHANAKELKIELTQKNGIILILSEDNGLGFDYAAIVKENPGLGLRSLLSRTEIMKGEMFVESKTGKGTRYTFEIPMV
jgi:signal transduction histidine kinase